MCRLSVIIPVYNTETKLQRCIDSILEYLLEDMEIILVNDGSTDKSGELCDKLAKKHSFIQVIHQKNSGAGGARNTGMKAARGKYTAFADSDDFFNMEQIPAMLELCEKNELDILGSSAYQLDENYNRTQHNKSMQGPQDVLYSGVEYIRKYKYTQKASVWLYIYRTKFLLDNNIWSEPKVYHQDRHFSLMAFTKAKRVMFHDFVHYSYVKQLFFIRNMKWSLDAIAVSKLIFQYLDTVSFGEPVDSYCRKYGAYVAQLAIQTCASFRLPLKEMMTKDNRKYLIKALSYDNRFLPISALLFLRLDFIVAWAYVVRWNYLKLRRKISS